MNLSMHVYFLNNFAPNFDTKMMPSSSNQLYRLGNKATIISFMYSFTSLSKMKDSVFIHISATPAAQLSDQESTHSLGRAQSLLVSPLSVRHCFN